MIGLLPESAEQRVPQQVQLGGYTLNVTYERPSPSATQGAQLLMRLLEGWRWRSGLTNLSLLG